MIIRKIDLSKNNDRWWLRSAHSDHIGYIGCVLRVGQISSDYFHDNDGLVIVCII